MDLDSVKTSYRRYAPRYDFLFGAVFHPGRKAVLEQLACQPGEKVLEVGVGTGLSLPLYPASASVTGIDLSEDMLAIARQRVSDHQLENVSLHCMNAQAMEFADNSFDKVVAMYVASVVPDPVQLVAEMRRVCKPGGQLVFVNHFKSDNPIIGGIERALVPLSARLGFNPGFGLQEFLDECGLELQSNQRVNAFGYWRMLQSRNDKVVVDSDADAEESATLIVETLEPLRVAAAK